MNPTKYHIIFSQLNRSIDETELLNPNSINIPSSQQQQYANFQQEPTTSYSQNNNHGQIIQFIDNSTNNNSNNTNFMNTDVKSCFDHTQNNDQIHYHSNPIDQQQQQNNNQNFDSTSFVDMEWNESILQLCQDFDDQYSIINNSKLGTEQNPQQNQQQHMTYQADFQPTNSTWHLTNDQITFNANKNGCGGGDPLIARSAFINDDNNHMNTNNTYAASSSVTDSGISVPWDLLEPDYQIINYNNY
jgi:hypothetical protein